MQTDVVQRSHWFKREGTSDKQYDITLERVRGTPDAAPLFVVNGWNGRRGATLKQQPKLSEPSPLAVAQATYDAEVKTRLKKKYEDKTAEVATSGGTYVPPERALVATQGDLQLLEPHDESELERFLTDDRYWAQEKKNGVRCSLRRKGDVVGAFGRDGQPMGFSRAVAAAAEAAAMDFQIDGESCGQTYWVFDAIQHGDVVVTSVGFAGRYAHAIAVVDAMRGAGHTCVELVPLARTTAEKRALLAELRGRNAEGIVFKKADAWYKGGESNRSDDQVKIKFCETATVRVCAAEAGRKARVIGLEALDTDGRWVFVGHATAKANQAVPPLGSVVEVQYLYVHQRGGALVQPELLSDPETGAVVRTDVGEAACALDQFKIKGD